MIRSDQTAGLLPALPRAGFWDRVFRSISRMQPKPQPLLGTLEGGTPEQIITFLRQIYQSIPRSKALWQLKDAPSFDLLPPRLLLRLLADSPDYLAQFEGLNMGDDLIRFFQQRYDILTAVGRQTHLTFSIEGFRSMMETGRMAGHPASIRPLTSAERAEFLDMLLFSIRKKPGFHLHLLHEGMRVKRFHMTGIDGYGLLFSGISPKPESRPAFSPEPLLISQYLDFYKHELLPRHVLSDAESLKLLMRMRGELPMGGDAL